ncbi:MAG: sodium:proton antiporter [Rhodothalassiaceae bacterium]
METFIPDIATAIALVIAAGVGAQWIAARFRFPSILLLLLIGFVAGPLTGLLDPDALFGDLLFPAVSLGVAVILFEGSLTLRFADLKGAEQIVIRLITLGVATTAAAIGATAHFLLGLDWQLALLFGAVASVSGPTVIMPLLRAVRPTEHLSRILRWEGILIDPVGAVLAVIAFETILAGVRTDGSSSPFLDLLRLLLTGGAIGAVAGYLTGEALKRHLIPDYLINPSVFAFVLLIFVLANLAAHEGGLVAVTAMGLVIGNLKDVPREGLLDFKEGLTLLLISGLFILLAARIDPRALIEPGPAILVLLLVILFLVRPLAALVSTIGTDLSWQERALLAWIAPRGIVAAAVSALFAIRLEAEGVEDAALLVPLTFAVIVTTVVVHSLTARPLARFLGVAEPEARGVLIVGGNRVARAIARLLMDAGLKVLLADASYTQIRAARMAGIPTFFGNAVSEYADRKLDLLGLGAMLALSTRPSLNALAALRYRQEFGSANVFTVRREQNNADREVETISFDFRGRLLFKTEMTLERLDAALEKGGELRITRLSEEYPFERLLEAAGDKVNLLFAITPEGRLRPFLEETPFKAGNGWRIVWLSANEKAQAQKPAQTQEPAT